MCNGTIRTLGNNEVYLLPRKKEGAIIGFIVDQEARIFYSTISGYLIVLDRSLTLICKIKQSSLDLTKKSYNLLNTPNTLNMLLLDERSTDSKLYWIQDNKNLAILSLSLLTIEETHRLPLETRI